ncbi:MAG: hypothetical protein ABIQ16_27405, partial [Polyangiaceae bacterium]
MEVQETARTPLRVRRATVKTANPISIQRASRVDFRGSEQPHPSASRGAPSVAIAPPIAGSPAPPVPGVPAIPGLPAAIPGVPATPAVPPVPLVELPPCPLPAIAVSPAMPCAGG